jgi:hypothetical protein
MCPHTPAYVSVLLLRMCPHTTICVLILLSMCPHTPIYVSSRSYLCVLTSMCTHTIHVSSYYMCLILLQYVSSHYGMCPHTTCPLTTTCVFILLHMCPHTRPMCPHTPSCLLQAYRICLRHVRSVSPSNSTAASGWLDSQAHLEHRSHLISYHIAYHILRYRILVRISPHTRS